MAWFDWDINEMKALIEAAEAGRMTGKLKRSPKRLSKALKDLLTTVAAKEAAERATRTR